METKRSPMKGRTRSLLFREEFFVPSEAMDCLPTCFAMAARYWKYFRPELPIPTELDVWIEYARRVSDISQRGTSIRRLLARRPADSANTSSSLEEYKEVPEISEKIEEVEKIEKYGLVVVPKTLEGVEDLVVFLETSPAIPVILAHDLHFMTHNVEYGQHTVLLISIDFDKEKLFVIDPMKVKLREPYAYDINRFKKSWVLMQNLSILVFPPDMVSVTSGEFRGVSKQVTLDEFGERVRNAH